ncbi:MAG: four helix bundle protein [Chloroflexi bacterium]|nr:MAG: four helix bundle protein [Chloroflexota bacterium]
MPVWQLAFKLTLEIYKVTKQFPSDERFGLISDMRRAANSIAHNIAEGFGRFEAKDKTRFYKISRGSAYELMSQLMVSHALNYLNEDYQNTLLQDCRNIITNLNPIIKTLEQRGGKKS